MCWYILNRFYFKPPKDNKSEKQILQVNGELAERIFQITRDIKVMSGLKTRGSKNFVVYLEIFDLHLLYTNCLTFQGTSVHTLPSVLRWKPHTRSSRHHWPRKNWTGFVLRSVKLYSTRSGYYILIIALIVESSFWNWAPDEIVYRQFCLRREEDWWLEDFVINSQQKDGYAVISKVCCTWRIDSNQKMWKRGLKDMFISRSSLDLRTSTSKWLFTEISPPETVWFRDHVIWNVLSQVTDLKPT